MNIKTILISLLIGLLVGVSATSLVILNKHRTQENGLIGQDKYIKDPDSLAPISSSTPLYKSIGPIKSVVSIFATDIPAVTQLEITPDGNNMLVGTLNGTIYNYKKVNGTFRKQEKPFYTVPVNIPAFPVTQNGLTGIAFGADFTVSKDVFLFYSYKNEKQDNIQNAITRVTLSETSDSVQGINPVQIYNGNTPTRHAHQIQDGVGIMINNVPHLMFSIGDGFILGTSLTLEQEAGKLMIIQRDGKDPVGQRPYPKYPRIQAIGLRNGSAIAYDEKDNTLALTDTSNENYDRFIYGTFFSKTGKNISPLSFNWDGTDESAVKDVIDPYINKNSILYRWTPAETPVGTIFYEHAKIPKKANQKHVLVSLFGETMSEYNKPGKRIMLGTITTGTNNSINFVPFIERIPEAKGRIGHPLSITSDPITKSIYFSDIIEGRIYKIDIQ